MSNMKCRKGISLILVLVLLMGVFPVSSSAADRGEIVGQVAFLAVTADNYLIEPCYIGYAKGETVKEMLQASGHTFAGIESGFISAIDGVVGNYSLHYDENGYSLDTPAEKVTALWFTTNSSQAYSKDLLDLVSLMAEYNTSTNGVKDYAGALEAYRAATKGFYQAGDAAKLYADLDMAMAKFDAFQAGSTVDVGMNITCDGNFIGAGEAVFTSEYGTTHRFADFSTVALVPGEYDFDISDGGYHHVRGSVTVEEGTILTAEIPSGTWIGSLKLGIANGSNWKEMPSDHVTASGATFYIPDYAGPTLYPYMTKGEGVPDSVGLYLAGDATDKKNKRVWESKSTALTKVITAGSLEGTVLVMEARLASGDYEQYQTFTMTIVRTPSLEDLTVSGDGTQLKLDFDRAVQEYTVTASSDTVVVTPSALCPQATVTVAGNPAVSGEGTAITLADCPQEGGKYRIPVIVTAPNGQETTYTIQVEKVEAVEVTVTTADTNVHVQLYNDAGAEVRPAAVHGSQSTFRLIPGNTYTWITTQNTYYHATGTFTAEANLRISAASPKVQDWATNLAAQTSSNAASQLTPDSPFDPADHEYTFREESNTTTIRLLTACPSTSTYEMWLHYTSHENSTYSSKGGTYGPKLYDVKNTSNTAYKSLTNCMAAGGWGNTIRIEYKQKAVESGVTYYQDYFVRVDRVITLNTMSAVDSNGTKMVLAQKADPATVKYDKTVLDYIASIGQTEKELTVQFKPLSSYRYDADFTVTVACGAWSKQVTFSVDVKPNVLQTVTVPLDTTKASETITVTVSHAQESSIPQTYTIEITKLPPVETTIVTTPADATVFLTNDVTGNRILPEADGSYTLDTGTSYTYTITKNGYVGQSGSFVAGEANKAITVSLAAAPESTLTDIAIDGDWPQFRADSNNNGVVNVLTPIKAEDAVLEWANKIGEGWDTGATGCPILVGGYLYTYAGKAIHKINKDTGEVVASGVMAASSSFAINSPTYAEGMIFVALSNGRIQAFNAETLESLWLYQDSRKGQPNCPIAYCDGYIYTGFWNSETKQANFVCLSVTDEDPTQLTETKLSTWTYTHNGFYWAGAYVCENFVLVGTDDGESGYTTGYASILSMDPKTGKLLDSEKLSNVGDQRSSICYDTATDAYYFTTKGGDLYQVKVNADGSFTEDSLRRLRLENGTATAAMSTSTPVIYNGRAYIGVAGSSQFGAYSGHNITVVDLESFSIAYSVPTMGYPQTSGLLTTAYEETDGFVYVYFIDNYTPGKIRVIRDMPGMTAVDPAYITQETYTVNGEEKTVDAAYVLFTPYGDEAQYAICSPIVDSEGNLYFKNDSARLMRLGHRITSLEVTRQPDKLVYEKDMKFDGTGLQVIAHYANGTSKDISDYLSYTGDPLTMDDTEITISYDPNKLLEKPDSAGYWQWYRDAEGAAGAAYYNPTATVTIELRADHTWDAGVQTAAPDCTNAGEAKHTCEVCGVAKTEPIPATGHTMVQTDAKAATCTEAGNVAYYTCTACGKNFADEEGTTELTDVAIPATGHIMVKIDTTAATCTGDGNVTYYTCTACGKNFADEEGKTELTEVVIPATGHTMVKTDEKAATCTEDGNVAYYTCTVCGKNFADEEGRTELFGSGGNDHLESSGNNQFESKRNRQQPRLMC